MRNYKKAMENANRYQRLDVSNFINVRFDKQEISQIVLKPTSKTRIILKNKDHQIKSVEFDENYALLIITNQNGDKFYLDILGNVSQNRYDLSKGEVLLKYLIKRPLSPYQITSLGAISSYPDISLRLDDLDYFDDKYFSDELFVEAIKEKENNLYEYFKANKLFSNSIVAIYYKLKLNRIIKSKIKKAKLTHKTTSTVDNNFENDLYLKNLVKEIS